MLNANIATTPGLLSYIVDSINLANSLGKNQEKEIYLGMLAGMVRVATQSSLVGSAEDQRILVTPQQGADPVFLTLQPDGLLHGLKKLTSPPCCSKIVSKALWREWNIMVPEMRMEDRDTFLLMDVFKWVWMVVTNRVKRKIKSGDEFKRLLHACKGPLLQWLGKMADRWV